MHKIYSKYSYQTKNKFLCSPRHQKVEIPGYSTLIGMIYESKKNAHLYLVPPRGMFYKTWWAWQGIKSTWLMSIFTNKKVSNFLIKLSCQNLIQKRQVPSLMPIMVKPLHWHNGEETVLKKVLHFHFLLHKFPLIYVCNFRNYTNPYTKIEEIPWLATTIKLMLIRFLSIIYTGLSLNFLGFFHLECRAT